MSRPDSLHVFDPTPVARAATDGQRAALVALVAGEPDAGLLLAMLGLDGAA